MCQLDPACGAGDADDFSATAASLAAAVPYEVSLDDVEIECLHGQVAASELAYAVNGMLVGLMVVPEPAQVQPAMQPVSSPPLACIGIGCIRSVNASTRTLYVLTDVPEEELQQVTCLRVGKLELPAALQHTQHISSPYYSLFCLSGTAAAGAGVIKSRNNLLRQSLLGQA